MQNLKMLIHSDCNLRYGTLYNIILCKIKIAIMALFTLLFDYAVTQYYWHSLKSNSAIKFRSIVS